MTTTVEARTPNATTSTMTQAYAYAFDPTPEQANLLRSHIGGSRFCYNTLLGLVKDNWDENRAKRDAGDEVTKNDYLSTSHFDLLYLWAEKRDELAPWWSENGASTYNDATQRLSRAFANWRRGTAKFPTFKAKGRGGSVRFTNTAVRLTDSHHVRISRIGEVKTYESMRKLYRHLERGTGRIVAATISERGSKWTVSFTVDVQRATVPTRAPEKVVGVDVGLTTLYTGATASGEHVLDVANPHHLGRAEKKLARAQRVASLRQGPRQGVAPSKRWKKANYRVRRVHAGVVNSRRNLIHETTTMLAKRYDVIVVEDLNVAGMMKNHSLAKHISDAAWGEFVRQLEYKTKWYGSTLVKAGRFYASSKTCSQCGTVKAKLSLDERVFHCEACGLAIGRDVNAAINLARQGLAGTHSVTGRGGEVRPGRQNIAGQAHPDEASTDTPALVGA
ncbi:MAG: IS200/IS605 family element transposase accessory protein TnpB [Acidobacteria bacterium]|nr:IS200/IS605 family element transposase accessory protein TnpB [Acidobacteriota bacterium]